MKGSQAGVVLGMMTVFAVSLGAQRTSHTTRPLTNAQLQARVNALEEEKAALGRNYDQLLASCRSEVEPDARDERLRIAGRKLSASYELCRQGRA